MFYKQCSNLKTQYVDDEILILDISKGSIHQLNATAASIWKKCDGRSTKQDLVDYLVHDYGIDAATATNDIDAILVNLQNLELIEVDTNS